MSKQIRALVSWVLALTFVCLIVTGFSLMFHTELFGLRGYPLKVVHINLAILSVVAGIGHIYFNLDTLCRYVWIRKKGPNMIGAFLVALAMTVTVIGFSAMTPTRCDEQGPRHRAGEGQGYGRGEGRGEGQGRGEGHGEEGEGFGVGRGQGGEGRGLGPGQGRGLRRGQGYGREHLPETEETQAETP